MWFKLHLNLFFVVSQWETIVVSDIIISEDDYMYDIGIPEINVIARSESTDERAILYDAEAIKRPEKCINPKCECKIKPHVHSANTNLLHDVKSEGKLVYIKLKIHRYRCPECGCVFPDEFTFYSKNAHFTNRLKKEFVDRVIKGETFTYIGNDYSIDHKTVAAAFKTYTENNKELFNYNYTPEVLGLDEAHIDEHYRLVITDIKEQRLIDMKRDNKANTIKAYLKTLDKTTCNCVTMDFAPIYAKCVNIIIPNALIVIDKFHAVQEVNRCLDKTRIMLQNQLHNEKGIDMKRFKRAKHLFMTNWEDLSVEENNCLNRWFLEFPELFVAYMTKETFRDIYTTVEDINKATDLFNKWLDAIPPYETFGAMRKTMNRRKDHILNYWNAPYTNAYTESVNNIIKKIEKAGRGYKFDTLRERCMLEINTDKPGRFNPKEAIFVSKDIKTPIRNKVKELYISPVYQMDVTCITDYISLIDSLEIYLEVFNPSRYNESLEKRLNTYSKKFQEKNKIVKK